jgi:hypothetical protein
MKVHKNLPKRILWKNVQTKIVNDEDILRSPQTHILFEFQLFYYGFAYIYSLNGITFFICARRAIMQLSGYSPMALQLDRRVLVREWRVRRNEEK